MTSTRYELELTNEQADAIYRMARGNPAFGVTWAEQFRTYIPIPVPTAAGAVVETERGTFVLAACGKHWISESDAGGNHEFLPSAMLPPITAVRSQGVAL